MGATEIIEQLKGLPSTEQQMVKDFLERNLATRSKATMYDEFTILGDDTEGSDVNFAEAAAVVRHGE